MYDPTITVARRDLLHGFPEMKISLLFCIIGSFFTRFASEIESDPVGDYPRAKEVLQQLDIDPETVTDEDFSSLRYVCEVVSRRASFMASAGITALLKKMDYKDVVIAIDGSLFR